LTPAGLIDWARRWNLPPQAFAELRQLTGAVTAVPAPPGQNEAYSQSQVRLEAAAKGVRLWRNNVGALQDAQGRWVRYGLANDSKTLNEKLKSSDLIGWRPVAITQAHVGCVLAQFVSRECKAPGWKYAGTDRETAQETWLNLVLAEGGDAAFTTGPGSL